MSLVEEEVEIHLMVEEEVLVECVASVKGQEILLILNIRSMVTH